MFPPALLPGSLPGSTMSSMGSTVEQLTGRVVCRYQGLVCSAMVEKELEFAMLIAIVNNNLIAYDQSRDLAFAIDSAIKEGAGEEGEERRSDGSTESLSMNETEGH